MSQRSFGAVLAFSLSLGLAHPALGQETDEAAVMAAYQKAMTPSAAHAKLAEMEGTWALEIKMWMEPGAEPIVSTAINERVMAMGGRYLVDEVTGDGMPGFPPFNGYGWTGYDNVEEQYVATWIDNVGTGIFTSHGEWDVDADALIMYGSYTDPVTGNKVKVKSVTKMEGPDKEIFRWYEKREGDEEGTMTMEIISTRQ